MVTPDGGFMKSCGSPTATQSMRPPVSCSSAAIAAPAPLETLEAMTMTLSEERRLVLYLVPLCTSPYFWLSMKKANSIARSVSRPHVASGFCCECAAFQPQRFGWAPLNAARSEVESFAANCDVV